MDGQILYCELKELELNIQSPESCQHKRVVMLDGEVRIARCFDCETDLLLAEDEYVDDLGELVSITTEEYDRWVEENL